MDVAHPELADQAGEVTSTASPRDRLIAAATRLFCRYGVNSVGVDEIVAAATTAKTTLYRLFGSKDGLVEAVLESEGRIGAPGSSPRSTARAARRSRAFTASGLLCGSGSIVTISTAVRSLMR